MILYFADRRMNILGQATTGLPGGLSVSSDTRAEDVETGAASFECFIGFDKSTRADVERFVTEGNYLLRSHKDVNEFYTIVEVEIDSKAQEAYLYAESQGLDLLNEICTGYLPTEEKTIAHYIEKFAYDSGFVIGKNDIPDEKRKLAWTGENTATERLADVAAQFDCEISYSFAIKGMKVDKKYINIHKKRGTDTGVQLRLGKEVDRIVTKKSVANLATALRVTGGAVDQERTILETTSNGVAYAVELEAIGRTEKAVTFEAIVTASLVSATATLGEDYGLSASLYIGGAWRTATIKATDKDNKQNWKGTTKHSTVYTFTVSGIAAGVVDFTGIKFKVSRTDSKGGSSGILAETVCANFRVTNYIAGAESGDNLNSRPITLDGYSYDDGDFFLEGTYLKSRNALAEWSRYLAEKGNYTGHICKTFDYDTSTQKELCEKAIEELKRLRKPEVNYEIDLITLPEGVRIGDRVNVIDDAGGLYISTRLLKTEESAANQTYSATFGEFLLQSDGISAKVNALADKFAKASQASSHVLEIAKKAKSEAQKAQAQAETAMESAGTAQTAAETAQAAADTATQSANEATQAASEAKAAVDNVEKSVESLEEGVNNATLAAQNAQTAAGNAVEQAGNAAQNAAQAVADAADAKAQVTIAQSNAESAISKANEATQTANTAKNEATTAKTTAEAAKADAQKAQEDIDSLGENLETLSNTMTVDYARKTDLTETTASLQTQITQNAGEINLTAKKVQEIDETANNAKEQAETAQATAAAAQSKADTASADAQKAQTAATNAATAAANAQSEADKAKTAAANAQSEADAAKAELETAKTNLASVTSRVDATEEEIAAAQEAVTAAQNKADKAESDAANAATAATNAQTTANTAKSEAEAAQTAANNAASAAQAAQATADEAKTNAQAARTAASEAAEAASAAQSTANTAKTNAANAQAKADQAASDAAKAQTAADAAKADAEAAQSDLDTAKANLATVTGRVDATEEEIAAAQQAVETAQAAADKAKQDAATAQSTANTAKANAATAQTAANNAKTAADNAQKAADDAQDAADAAQSAVDSLAVRVTTAETQITNNSEQILLRATKTEVTETLGGYYTKEETEAKITTEANQITSSVSATYATKDALADTAEDVTELSTRVTQTESSITSQATSITEHGTKISTLEQNAEGFSLRLDTVEDDVDTAQSTANTAKTNAATAQTTANNAQTAATNAAKTATNFMEYTSSGGLQVGNKSSGSWSGTRTQTLPDSFNILGTDGTELATYGADKVELGKNSKESVIELCGGVGMIRANIDLINEGVLDGIDVVSDVAALMGTNGAHLVAKNDAVENYVYANTDCVRMAHSNYRNGEYFRTAELCVSESEAEMATYSADGQTEQASLRMGTDIDLTATGGILLTDSNDLPAYIGIYGNDSTLANNKAQIDLNADGGAVNIDAESVNMGGAVYDQYGKVMSNGLASYSGSGTAAIDPNTTLEHTILTNHSNAPVSGTFFYIQTVFYQTKSTSASRAQFAIPYGTNKDMYIRRRYQGEWSAWAVANAQTINELGDAHNALNEYVTEKLTNADVAITADSTNVRSASMRARYTPSTGMAMCVCYFENNVSMTARTAYTVGTVPADYRPSRVYALACHSTRNISAFVNASGQIRITPKEDFSAGFGIYISGMWLL